MDEKEDIIVVYGTRWCGDSRRAKNFFDTHQIPYKWMDIDENPEASDFVRRINHGFRSVPTIVFPDGSRLVEPSIEQLAEKLGVSANS
jgi:glutaredoxin-like protein